uniref:Chemosensory protein n=1 Tax=Glyphodes pyloalis TaxID=1242752 RepID=A0A6M3GTW4_GLYPY|nr:chemosensory protein [Glyphodes pyloalis]
MTDSRSVVKISLFLQAFCLMFVLGTQQKFYDSKYDYFDIDSLVQNPRLLRNYMDCFLDKGPCTPIGRVFKIALPEVIATSCSKCTPAQRSFAKRTFGAFRRDLPELNEELKKHLDPGNKHFDKFEKTIVNA